MSGSKIFSIYLSSMSSMSSHSASSARACIATSTCVVQGWNHELPGSITLHLLVDRNRAQQQLRTSWLHAAIAGGMLDCSDISGDRRVWSMRPFDPQQHAVSPSLDAEALLVLADVGRLARKKGAGRPLPACSMAATQQWQDSSVRIAWHGSYRVPPPQLSLASLFSALSPRTAIVLPHEGHDSALLTRLLREHGVTRSRTLFLRGGGESARASSATAHGMSVLRFTANLLQPSLRELKAKQPQLPWDQVVQ